MALVRVYIAARGDVTWGLDEENDYNQGVSGVSKWLGSGPSGEGVSMTFHGPDETSHTSEATSQFLTRCQTNGIQGSWQV